MATSDLKKTLFQYVYDIALPHLKKEFKLAHQKYDKIQAAKLLTTSIHKSDFLKELREFVEERYGNDLFEYVTNKMNPDPSDNYGNEEYEYANGDWK